ncbi:Phosphatidylinositol transfer protein alpha isoform [Collichthys lucidus]|uniref:Phosphatidylinositol transfer protein beta isoform n=1 Tax=Collichthys lucidus TaxID=240159 RepID=A0A4U5VA26_COLLU|nr:Phosphatidylinositol transfer protein alpha isoform [Collichthys lucidus]
MSPQSSLPPPACAQITGPVAALSKPARSPCYQVGQLFSVAEASKNETGGGEGIEVLKNEPYEKDGEKGQYTHKIYHLKRQVKHLCDSFKHLLFINGSITKLSPFWPTPQTHKEKKKTWSGASGNTIWTCLFGSQQSVNRSRRLPAVQSDGARPPKQAAILPINEYMKDDFMIKIETWHKPDMGTLENIHDLEEQTWRTVEVVPIDISNKEEVVVGVSLTALARSDEQVWFPAGCLHPEEGCGRTGRLSEPVIIPEHNKTHRLYFRLHVGLEIEDYKPEEDPALFHSTKTGRGPLGPEWKDELQSDCPHMCAYKLVTVKFRWWGLQTKVENFIHKQEKRIFTNFHRQLFCWIDRWVGLTMEDIRRMEEETQKELEERKQRKAASLLLIIRADSTIRG